MRQELNQITPEPLKKLYRLFRYRNERNKFVREIKIKALQENLITVEHSRETNKLIVFLVPGSIWATGQDNITGGTISIVSLCEETKALKDTHQAETILCTSRGAHLLSKHTMFPNQTPVFRFEQLHLFFQSLSEIIIHLPEYMVEDFQQKLNQKDLRWLQGIELVHINIMNQNIRLMPTSNVIEGLKSIASSITITTAHEKYCTPALRQAFGIPVHKLSVWISPEQYQFRKWSEKENLIIVSPDPHPKKESILSHLAEIPDLRIQVIQNLKYDQYKQLISKARWALTFGEGLDGYLIEPVFSGAIGFAVYNSDFFTQDFKGLPTIFPTIEHLASTIKETLLNLNQEKEFTNYQQIQFSICSKYYNKVVYQNNLKYFYEKKYTLI